MRVPAFYARRQRANDLLQRLRQRRHTIKRNRRLVDVDALKLGVVGHTRPSNAVARLNALADAGPAVVEVDKRHVRPFQ